MRFFFTLTLLLAAFFSFGQNVPDKAPYLRFPTTPPLQLLLSDSTTRYTKSDLPKRKPVLIMVFSPECSHCQQTAEELVQNAGQWKDIHVVMATLHPIWQMQEFAAKYGLNKFPNLVIGRDVNYILPGFYGFHNLPYLAFYNKKGNLITGFEGSMPLNKILATFN